MVNNLKQLQLFSPQYVNVAYINTPNNAVGRILTLTYVRNTTHKFKFWFKDQNYKFKFLVMKERD